MPSDGWSMKPTKTAQGIATGVTRRTLFRCAAATAGGMAFWLGWSTSAHAKVTQKAVGYQETPKGDQSCSNCSLFVAPASCELVDGTISPQGWCRFHRSKS